MPTLGPFHRFYWKARANPLPGPGAGQPWMYPGWQSTVICAMAIWGIPFEAIGPLWRQLLWLWHTIRRLWWWRSPAQQATLHLWIDRLERSDAEQRAVLERVVEMMTSAVWADTRRLVRECAVSPKFHQPEQWLEYSRALKANRGQAQNVFRHIKVVHTLKANHPDLSNPDAHLLAELAYQGFASQGRAGLET